MLQAYDELKQILLQRGYETALDWVERLELKGNRDQLLKTNFYCYLTIQRGFKASQSLTILQNCLAQEYCKGAIRALTRYHICQIYFSQQLKGCGADCEQIIGEFIGSYHMLKQLPERDEQQEGELVMLQYIIYYCFLLLGHLRATEGRLEESQNYLSASKNLLKINNKSTQLITASFLRTQKPKSKE